MTLKCDLQYGKGDAEYKLTRVGVKGVRKPILVQRDGINGTLNNILNCSIDIFVDLPGNQKGSHMSRNVEVLNEIVDASIANPITAIEDVAADICRKLMVHHEYAQEGEVSIEAEYFRASKTPLGKNTFESYTLLAGGHIERDGELTKMVGVTVTGMTACPCGQQTVTEMLEIESEHPVMTHNQRNVCTLMVYMPENVSVEANELIDIVEASFSSPTYELLKRPDEGQVIINAHRNTKFVEDVVRAVLDNFVKRYTDLPDEVFIDVISDSEESIHKHDAYAEREATLGELRQENQ
ncbi:GTP cyclohydrolase MptA [Methanomassiliicoccales archaeon LGM-RCC1]|nr:GTP cyclohydrolase I FolE2 [Candidatus Methanomethylophilaceae archaeon]WII06833.1 GTP cyclohydrolase MptA [Methanomassiliicoccales archaeon LGM-RCC1]